MRRASSLGSLPARVKWSQFGIAALFGVTAVSQTKLQTVERANTLALGKAHGRYIQEAKDHARRGSILDFDGHPLAQDEDTQYLNVDFANVPHSDAFFLDLAAASGVSAGELASLADATTHERTWKQTISPVQADLVRRVKQRWRADGVSLVRSGRRDYPLGAAAASLVGFVREGKPITGLELGKSLVLGGKDGLQVGLVDKSGQFLPMREDSHTVNRQDGQNVTLTIDSDLQMAAAEAIRQGVEAHKADDGIAIILEPQTGNILAMASWPTFSPTNPDGSDADLALGSGFNPAYMSVLEPGSTFKLFTLAKALDMGKVTMADVIHCAGEMHVDGEPQWRIRCDEHHGNRAHGNVTPEVAIAKSCNVSAATWALRIGRPTFIKYIESLGLLNKPGLGLPMESSGLFNRNDWAKDLQLANMGFGQAINTTPVALAAAFDMLGNGGVYMRPRLIAKIGDRTLPIQPGVPIVRKSSADEVMHCMEAVIESEIGTGSKLKIPGYRLAGKTGTAQKIGRKSSGYVSNFVGFVPSPRPKALILVMLNHPTAHGFYGAAVAGPIFRDLAMAVIRRYSIPPTEPMSSVAMKTNRSTALR